MSDTIAETISEHEPKSLGPFLGPFLGRYAVHCMTNQLIGGKNHEMIMNVYAWQSEQEQLESCKEYIKNHPADKCRIICLPE